MGTARSPIRDKAVGIAIFLSIFPQFAVLIALLPPEEAVPQVTNNADGAPVFTLQTAFEAWFSPAAVLLLVGNVSVCSLFLARSRLNSRDSHEETAPSPTTILVGAVMVFLLFLAGLAVCEGLAEPFRTFRSVTIAGETIELESLAGERSIDRASIADVVVGQEDRTSYDARHFRRYYVEIHTKSGKTYRSVDVGGFEGHDPAEGDWLRLLRQLKSAIQN
ncbi:MAG: hypothetical protein GXX96_18635 [Planctomycetaceae bacterium]|nr:hypothetical protein [Planctomycetaceae bacterium]